MIFILGLLVLGCGKDVDSEDNDDMDDDTTPDVKTDEETVDDSIGDVSGLSDDIDEAESLDTLDEDLSILDEI